jgi:hypothetical protein
MFNLHGKFYEFPSEFFFLLFTKQLCSLIMSLIDERLHDGCDLEEFLGLFKDHVEGDPFGLGHRLDNYWFEAACHYDNVEVAQWLYKNSGYRLKLNGIKKYESSCALISAMQGSAYNVLRWLLTLEGLDVNIKVTSGLLLDSYEGSALGYAIQCKFPEDIIIAFLEKGAKKLPSEKLIVSQIKNGMTSSHANVVSQLLLHGANCREESERSYSMLGQIMVYNNTAYDLASYSLRMAENSIRLATQEYNPNGPAIVHRDNMKKVCFMLKHWETTMYMHCLKEAGMELDTESSSMLSSFCEQREFGDYEDNNYDFIPVFGNNNHAEEGEEIEEEA